MNIVNMSERETEEAVDGVHFTQLVAAENMSIQHFRIEPGTKIPEHSHPHEQVGYMISGELTAVVGDEEHIFRPGDSYWFESDEPHGAINHGDEPAIGVGIYSPPRRNPNWTQ